MRCDAGARAHIVESRSTEAGDPGETLEAALRPASWAIEAALISAREAPSTAAAYALLARATLTEALAAFDQLGP